MYILSRSCMSFSIAAHTDTRWAIGCYALTALCIALLSMVLPWISLSLLILLGWSTWKEKQGHAGWFRSWVPKQQVSIQVDWHENNDDMNQIHFYMDTREHWWIRSAMALLILTTFCWTCVFMGWVTLAFSILPVLCIAGVLGHKSASDTTINTSPSEGIHVYSPPETTWSGLQIFFEHHQAMLAKTGTLVVHGQASTIPIRLPMGFEDWTIKHQTV